MKELIEKSGMGKRMVIEKVLSGNISDKSNGLFPGRVWSVPFRQ